MNQLPTVPKSSAERESEFRRDLQELLSRHGAEMRVTDDGKPYGLHSAVCVIEMEGSYDYDNDCLILEYTEFEL